MTVKYVWDHDAVRRAPRNRRQVLGAKAIDDDKMVWSDPEIGCRDLLRKPTRHHDLVLAATPPPAKYVFAEKPMGIGSTESYEMADAS